MLFVQYWVAVRNLKSQSWIFHCKACDLRMCISLHLFLKILWSVECVLAVVWKLTSIGHNFFNKIEWGMAVIHKSCGEALHFSWNCFLWGVSKLTVTILIYWLLWSKLFSWEYMLEGKHCMKTAKTYDLMPCFNSTTHLRRH